MPESYYFLNENGTHQDFVGIAAQDSDIANSAGNEMRDEGDGRQQQQSLHGQEQQLLQLQHFMTPLPGISTYDEAARASAKEAGENDILYHGYGTCSMVIPQLGEPENSVGMTDDESYMFQSAQNSASSDEAHENVEAMVEADLDGAQDSLSASQAATIIAAYERHMMQSSMSPLLAAVDDVTKREAEVQPYFSQNLDKPSVSGSNGLLIPEVMDVPQVLDTEECQTIPDAPIHSRAKASLPRQFLKFGPCDSTTNEPTIVARKFIPHCSKFGPMEGDIVYVSGADWDVLHVQPARLYPLLLLDDSHVLDVSNESTSNWMRYVRLAETRANQNLQLVLEQGRLFFRTLRDIAPKEELCVGYHSAYADRFLLPTLQPTEQDLLLEKQREETRSRKCIECDKAFSTAERLQRHIAIAHKKSKVPLLRKRDARRRLRRSTERRNICGSGSQVNISLRCRVCMKMFMTCESLRQHRRRQHGRATKKTHDLAKAQSDKKGSTLEDKKGSPSEDRKGSASEDRKSFYKCDFCSKKYRFKAKFERHKATHKQNVARPYECHICQLKCTTSGALTVHVRSHLGISYTCACCKAKFINPRKLKQHVVTHKSNVSGKYECPECVKSFDTYEVLRRHTQYVHSLRKLVCGKCSKVFSDKQFLEKHSLGHDESNAHDKAHKCSKCRQEFSKWVNLENHRKSHRDWKGEQAEKDLSRTEAVKRSNSAQGYTPEKENLGLEATFINEEPDQPPAMSVEETTPLAPKRLSTSSSNRRKQTPMKLKATELNAEPVTIVALSDEAMKPFLLFTDFNKADIFNMESSKPIEDPIPSLVSPEPFTLQAPAPADVDNAEHSIPTTENRPTSSRASEAQPGQNPFPCPYCTNISFKRRGILVNHFLARHPHVNLDEVEVLNAPLFKAQRIFHCLYCQNTYRSSSKRRAHILKHHPDQKLPPSLRRSADNQEVNAEIVAHCESTIYKCGLCLRQYVSHNRLVTHYRLVHPEAELPKKATAAEQKVQEQRSIEVVDQPVVVDPQGAPVEFTSGMSMTASAYDAAPVPASPENKLLKLSSAALEMSRFGFLNERGASDDYNRLPALFDDTPLESGIYCGLPEREL